MKVYDQTEIVQKAWLHFDKVLDEKIEHIHELTGVPKDHLLKINPMDFVQKMVGQYIKGYHYQHIAEWIAKNKTPETFCISPLDEDVETANQICYKTGQTERKLRAHKCEVVPISSLAARRFFVKNHRQSIPTLSEKAVNFALVYQGEVVAVMCYDLTKSAVRGLKMSDQYELLRLSIKHGTQINGGASKLQQRSEEAIRGLGCTKIFSYSNATINEGNVYRQLGFEQSEIEDGHVWSVEPDFQIVRLVNCCVSRGYIGAKNKDLMERGAVKVIISANRKWTKDISNPE